MTKERIEEIYKNLLEAKKESETRFMRFNIYPHELAEILELALIGLNCWDKE